MTLKNWLGVFLFAIWIVGLFIFFAIAGMIGEAFPVVRVASLFFLSFYIWFSLAKVFLKLLK